MPRIDVKIKGGGNLAKNLQAIARKMSGGAVRVGFLENATYPSAAGEKTLHVAQVAFWNEFGTVRAPARPFFRNMVADQSPQWGAKFAKIVQASGLNNRRALGLMGEHIKDELVKAIVDWPADNAPSTVAKKGFNKGLIDTGVMQRAPAYEIINL